MVLPYLTWRAYDQWDDDGDGRPDTWYAAPGGEDGTTSGEPWRVALTGPYESAGAAPPGAERDGRNAWPIGPLLATRRHLQVITDLELGRLPDAAIDRYAGVLVAGHLEYYTDGLYRILRGYARRGGRMALLSANGLYREVEVSVARGTITADPRVVRAGGRRDQATLGSGYATCCFAGRPGYRLTAEAVRAVPWLLRGTGLRAGDRFGAAGIEVDGLGPWTPPRTVVVGTVDVQGQRERKTAVVTYLPSRVRGGGVLNMGNVFFLRSTVDPAIPEERRQPARRMLLNAWRWLANGTAPALLPPPDDGPRAPAGARSNPLRLPPPALDEIEPADIPLD